MEQEKWEIRLKKCNIKTNIVRDLKNSLFLGLNQQVVLIAESQVILLGTAELQRGLVHLDHHMAQENLDLDQEKPIARTNREEETVEVEDLEAMVEDPPEAKEEEEAITTSAVEAEATVVTMICVEEVEAVQALAAAELSSPIIE